MKKVIVTGASGFVGRNLIRQLIKEDVEVYAVVRNPAFKEFDGCSNVHLIFCELENIDKLSEDLSGIDFCAFYHLAWQGAKGAGRADYNAQILNAKYTCDAALVSKKLGCEKFITVGTITERLAENLSFDKVIGQNLMYGVTKDYTRKMLNILCAKEGIRYIWAELSNVFGGDDNSGNIISYTVGCFEKGETPAFGPCENMYDFIHIDDVSRALFEIGKKNTKENFYFIGRCENMLLKDYIQLLGDLYEKPVSIGARADDGLRYERCWFNNDGLVKELNFKFKYSFMEGVLFEKEKKERG